MAPFGFFVELADIFVEGLVHVSMIGAGSAATGAAVYAPGRLGS